MYRSIEKQAMFPGSVLIFIGCVGFVFFRPRSPMLDSRLIHLEFVTHDVIIEKDFLREFQLFLVNFYSANVSY